MYRNPKYHYTLEKAEPGYDRPYVEAVFPTIECAMGYVKAGLGDKGNLTWDRKVQDGSWWLEADDEDTTWFIVRHLYKPQRQAAE
ncbi:MULTISPECIES: hypothetical protein [Nocardia]|uniref:hypothetical protein n=1 Tax=Nocardia TaxID=1817 RepID=UPI0007A374A8|nr:MULTISPECIES: hypothetical protein [Nocardia]